MIKLVIITSKQIAHLWIEKKFVKAFNVSTALNGLGCMENSNCTPIGQLRVAEKIGSQCPYGTIFRSRISTGEIWDGMPCAEDLVLSRILWLEGNEEKNSNTKKRFIYLHGTNQENLLGQPASHGCIRFSNTDIIELYEILNVGDEIIVEE